MIFCIIVFVLCTLPFTDVFRVARPYGTFLAVILTYAASSLLHVS